MNTKTLVLLPAALILVTVTAQATTVLSYNFDGTLPNSKYGYTYSELGGQSHDNGIFSLTGGNGGTGGLVTTFNTTAAGGAWAGFGTGFGDWNGVGNYAALANASSLAGMTVSLDARAGGLTGASAGVTFELKFEAPDNTIVPNDGNTDTDVLLAIQLHPTLTSSFQTFSSTLDTWTITGGSFAQLQTFLAGVQNINLNIAYDSNGTFPAFGNDAGNTLAADNYLLTVIPEPSTLALSGLGAAALLLRRRK